MFDLPAILSVLDQSDVLIAHNATFDIRMVGHVVPNIARRNWLCSYRRWPWEKLANRKLDTICAHLRIKRPNIHGALADAHALRQVLMHPMVGADAGHSYLTKILA